MENVTIRMLAERLQLSTATISKALNNSHEISEETKQRVLALAAELNYVPNPYASSLRKKASNTIAVVIPEVADSFFAEAINGIESVAQEKGYHVLIYLTHESFQKEQAILRDFQSGRVDGVLISVTTETAAAQHGLEQLVKEIPIVFFDRVCEEITAAKITTDDATAAYKATTHLIAGGCRQPVMLSASRHLSISNKRTEGFRQALADHQLPFTAASIIYCSNDTIATHELLKKAIQKEHYDGIIATTEKLATAVYEAAAALHLQIPHDLQVIGFSNLSTAKFLNPSLTTITQPAFDMGKAAAALLFKALKSSSFALPEQQEVIPSTLLIRNSTLAAAD
ncbi:LacI family DNA-binding transcriptional regulator [Chitinophaga sp. 22321]|uniref:LacI family DNA-binding transcriptional regulator n=1 Tax=Chitinophaga hostae TaxID=2831022 RepID=A0ABS5J8P8_9BACT|nr:LacI family DNA-binding transcriptional regulator [Chitinophaga hostae]MBS0031560.1 LacI family DNA-binding transcriptional regulator [Chitinophaga hostae]